MVTLSLEKACNLSKNEHYNWQTILTTIDSWTHMLDSKDLGFYVFITLICIVGKPLSKQCV